MSSTLNDTINTAKHVMESAKDGTQHAVHSAQKGARSSLLGTVTAVGGLVSILRGFDLDEGLGLIGLTRKRTAFRSAAITTAAFFGAGLAIGAGAGLLFAPASGTQTRRAIRGRIEELKQDAEDTFERAEEEVKQLEQKAESFVTRAADTARKAEHKAENKVSEGVHKAKAAVKSGADAALGTVQNTAEEARSALRSTESGSGTGPRYS